MKLPAQKTATKTTAAEKYRERDAHEGFFRPKAKPKRAGKKPNMKKPTGKKQKRKQLTNAERTAWAKEYWHNNFGAGKVESTESAADSLPFSISSPDIMGYHNQELNDMNLTLPITPPPIQEMLEYFENKPRTRLQVKKFMNETMNL